jgi:hypothetical protein
MRVESDGNRLTIEVGPGKRDAALAVVSAHFVEAQKTKRQLVLAAVGCFAVAAGLLVFAPEGRERLAVWMGAALVVVGFAASGLARLRLKTPLGEIEVISREPENTEGIPAPRNSAEGSQRRLPETE